MSKANARKIPAVGYVRMSSGKQEASPPQQRAEIIKLAAKHNCEIIRWYFDKGISGDETAKRKDFQRMIRDAEQKGDFKVILCWDQDRFGRFDSIEAGRWIHPLREAGVRLITVAQGEIDWEDFAGRMIYNIQQEGKHQFLIDLSKNVLRGKLEAARQGRGASVPPYGYDRAYYDRAGKLLKRVPYGEKFTKPRDWQMRFVLSEDTQAVDIARWMFETFANTDCGMSWIAQDLNRRGVPSPQGKTWSVQTVEKILTNRTYTGANKFGEHPEGKYHHTSQAGEIERGNGRTRKGKPIVVEGIHDALIDKAIFARVQAKLAERRSTGRRPRYSRYLLSGVLRCGHCGGTLAGKGYHKKAVPRYYACVTGATRPGACCRYQIPQKEIEEYVLKAIEERLLAPDAARRIKEAIRHQAKKRTASSTSARDIKAKMRTLDKKIAKGAENMLLADPADFPDLSKALAQWKAQRGQLQATLNLEKARADGQSIDQIVRHATAELSRLADHLRTGDPMKVRAVVQSLVHEIRLWWEPYGKRNKRLAHGVLQWRTDLEFVSMGKRTASATSWEADTPTGRP